MLVSMSDASPRQPARDDSGGDPACWAHLDERPLHLDDPTLAQLVRVLADAVVVADRNGTITLWNAAAARLFGWTSSEALGQPLTMIIPERLRTRHTNGYARVMDTGATQYGDRLLRVPALRRDGRPLSIAFTVTLLHDQMRNPVGVAAVIRDDTEAWRQRQATRTETTVQPP